MGCFVKNNFPCVIENEYIFCLEVLSQPVTEAVKSCGGRIYNLIICESDERGVEARRRCVDFCGFDRSQQLFGKLPDCGWVEPWIDRIH